MPESADVITVDRISRHFGGIRAVEDVSFVVARGTIHAVIGPNGAGKSTCFNLISGVYPPSSGRVFFGEQEFTGLPAYRAVEFGIARTFQNIVLAQDETVETNLLVARHRVMKGGVLDVGFRTPRYWRAERANRDRVREIAEFMGIDKHLTSRVNTLAYGVQKRVEMARALAAEPKVLMLDEPVAGMNASETDAMVDLIRQCHRSLDLTVVVIEHDMGMVMGLADSITVLDFGRVIASGNPQQIQSDPAVIAAYLGAQSSEEQQSAEGSDR